MQLPIPLPETEEAQYSKPVGNARYLDGESLLREPELPKSSFPILGVILIIAVVISVYMMFNFSDNVLNGAAKDRQAVQAILEKPVSHELPNVASLVGLSDEEIIATLQAQGLTVMLTSAEGEYPAGGFSAVVVPEGVDPQAAVDWYKKGLTKIPATDAAKLVNGSWTITVSRTNGFDLRIKLCDFASSDVHAAVTNAINASALAAGNLGESGTDSVGNIYQAGSIATDAGTAAWRVSATDFASVYSISAFPDTGAYVGIRIEI